MSPRVPVLLLLILLLAGGSSCYWSRETVAPWPEAAAPAAASAAGALQRLQWAVNQSRPELLDELLSGDFELVRAGVDSAGNLAQVSVPRDSVLVAFRSMLEGVPGRSLPAKARLELDRNLIEFPDTRPGRDPHVHRSVRSSFDLSVRDVTDESTYEVTGVLLIHASRGDSVALPASSTSRSDAGRWWITRIEDEAFAGPGARRTSAHPASKPSLWQLLEYYLARVWG